MDLQRVREGFDRIARQYDAQRRKLIPCFDDYYGMTTAFLAGIISPPSTVLDLGAGTGLLAQYIFDRFPAATFTLVDISDQMLAVARERFSGMSNCNFLVCDYSRDLPAGQYDLICSGLSIHHLEDSAKRNLYGKIFQRLNEGGCFINIDQFNAETNSMNERYNRWWQEHIRQTDLPPAEKASWLKRRELDRENTIEETKQMLRDAEFSAVECIYSYIKFGVILALKTG